MGGQRQSSQNAENAGTGQVFYVSTSGVARAWLDESPAVTKLKKKKREEAARIAAIRASGRAPKECGPDIVKLAPARGAVVAFNPSRMVAVGNDGYAHSERGHKGRKALQVLDALQKLNLSMARPGVAVCSERLVDAARAYGELTERYAASGLKCSSAFQADAQCGALCGGGDALDATDRSLAMRRRLEACHRAIGTGIAKEVRRRRPSARGTAGVKKASIFDRALVDRVCLGGESLTQVLHGHGWSDKSENIKALYAALCAALERLSACF